MKTTAESLSQIVGKLALTKSAEMVATNPVLVAPLCFQLRDPLKGNELGSKRRRCLLIADNQARHTFESGLRFPPQAKARKYA